MGLTTTPVPVAGPAGRADSQARSAWRWYLRVLSTVATTGVCVIAALAIVTAIATRMSPRGQYVVFGHPVMTVLSGSMAPVIRTGDLIVDDPVTAAQAEHLHAGQIISVRFAPGSQSLITHRIVAVQTRHGVVSYITRGDANNAADFTPRPTSDVIGVFRFAIPRGGYVLADLQRPIVLGLLLASPLLWLLAGPLIRFGRHPHEPEGGEPQGGEPQGGEPEDPEDPA